MRDQCAELWNAIICRERRSGRSAGKKWRGGDRERERERTIAKMRGMGKERCRANAKQGGIGGWVGAANEADILIIQGLACRGGNGHRIRGDPRSPHLGPIKPAAIGYPGSCKCQNTRCP